MPEVTPGYDPTRISPRLPVAQPTGSRVARALCRLLGHDPVVVWPKAHCRRCKRVWGG